MTSCLLIAGIACLAQLQSAAAPNREIDNETLTAGLDPSDKRTQAFVEWLRKKGVTLEYQKRTSGYGMWKVIEPKVETDAELLFSIRAMPAWATDEQMQAAVKSTNLAYLLNAPAHLSISYGSLRGKFPEAKIPTADELPKIDGEPVAEVVQRLFSEYRPK
jgi:hypothetical protein